MDGLDATDGADTTRANALETASEASRAVACTGEACLVGGTASAIRHPKTHYWQQHRYILSTCQEIDAYDGVQAPKNYCRSWDGRA